MQRLIIVGGASGAGKSYFLEQAQKNRKITPIKKISTRKSRNYEVENNNNIFFDVCGGYQLSEIKKCDYYYKYIDDYYGFNKKDIDDILNKGYNPIIIVKSNDIYERLKSEYNAIGIYIVSVLSGKDLEQTLKKQGRNDIEIKKRMERINQDIKDYSDNILTSLYDYILINCYDETLNIQIDKVFNKEKIELGE